MNDTCANAHTTTRTFFSPFGYPIPSQIPIIFLCILHTGIQSRDTITRWLCDVVKIKSLLETTAKRTDETTTINILICVFCITLYYYYYCRAYCGSATLSTYRNVNQFYNVRQRQRHARTGLLVEGARLCHKCIRTHTYTHTRKSARTFATKWLRDGTAACWNESHSIVHEHDRIINFGWSQIIFLSIRFLWLTYSFEITP